jgi:hypothetical protein
VIADARTDHPVFTHRLGVALQFFDVFTGATVRAPLHVTLQRALQPSRKLVALRPTGDDGIYRVLVPEPPFPPPPPEAFLANVEAAGGEYVSHEAISVLLPRTASAPPPPALRSDYLVRAPLWPTVLVRPSPGETALLGHVVSGVSPNLVSAANYKVVVGTANELLDISQIPYARTNAQGDFLYRLSRFRVELDSQGNFVSTVPLSVLVFTPADVQVASVSVNVELGRIFTQQLIVP